MNACRFVLSVAMVTAGCSGEASAPIHSGGPPVVDLAMPPWGVPDRGDDPAVLALDFAGDRFCSAALIAPDVMLSAGRCLIHTPTVTRCPVSASITSLPSPSQVRVLVSEKGGFVRERATARGLLVASSEAGCLGDLAFVLLDTTIDEIAPLVVRATGAARGDRVRTVDFERPGADGTLVERVRDHLPVVETTDTDLAIGEKCGTSLGAPALDESTTEIVGVALPSGDGACLRADPSTAYARADAFLGPIGEALSQSYVGQPSTRGRQRTKKGPIDMGANCAHGSDCAAGICVEEPGQAYCSRTCGPHDRCPAHFACEKSAEALWVCVER
jgi:hypothetical protein